MRRMRRLLACLVLTQFALLPSVAFQRAEANSAQRYWEGVSSTGAIVMDEDCPLEVQSEKLVFDIGEFPDYTLKESFSAYSSNVSAEYTFYNPADYTVRATLVFPFGKIPYWYYDGEAVSGDADKYAITVNGENVEKKLRFTLSPFAGNFDIEKDLPLLADDYVDNEFYSPDLSVTCYQYEVSNIDKDYNDGYAMMKPSLNPEKSRIWFTESNGWELDGDTATLGAWAKNGTTFTVYVFGEPLSEMPKWSIHPRGERESVIDGTFSLKHTAKMTFEQFIFEGYFAEYPKDSEINEIDWYNAMVVALDENTNKSYGVINSRYRHNNIKYDLMRWYEYEIEVAPKSTLVNKVTAPLYPTIDGGYSPNIHEYTYLLSPAKTWRKFGKLDIEIHTPYYLLEDEWGFTKTETGYVLSLDGLPDSELIFKLCSSEDPEPVSNPYGWLLFLVLLPMSCTGFILHEVGCSAVISTCGVFVPLILSATVLWIRKKK